MRNKNLFILSMRLAAAAASLVLCFAQVGGAAEAEGTLELQPLIDEALQNNHDVWVTGEKWKASRSQIKVAGSLPDPMVMIGYQNEGWDRYTFGRMEGAQWMYSVSQMFPFAGKRALREEMAARDADTAGAMYRSSRLAAVARVKELYYDLFLVHKSIDLIRERVQLFSKVEEAALARYAAGMGPQQEVLMAQTEKYMLQEREEMLKQRRIALEAMLIAVTGVDRYGPLGRPAELPPTVFSAQLGDLEVQALQNSPEVRSREQMLKASEAGAHMAEKEYYPDVTLTGTVGKRSGPFEDMWSITATFNIPLYFRSRQGQALASARAMSSAAVHDLAGTRSMLRSGVRDAFGMMGSAEQLMALYRDGLIPKTYQDFQLSLTGYRSGKIEAITAISRLKALLDYETSYWTQYVEREKAIARIEALTGAGDRTGAQGEIHHE
jgi:outer membrane protein TolC